MGYGKLPDDINVNLTAAMVKTTTGMSLNDYAAQMDGSYAVADSELQKMKQQVAEMRQEMDKPFEETEDFREFVIWLCGCTSRHTPPNQEEWEELRNASKKMAANFALATRSRRQGPHLRSYIKNGISGSDTLQGNEESLFYK